MSRENEKIRIGIAGFGNLGRGVAKALEMNQDMELVAVFTRRNPLDLDTSLRVVSYNEMKNFTNDVDVMILCGGSATDLPKQGPEIARSFNTVDSFDNHHEIPNYFSVADRVAQENKHVSLISTGWDPGLFSMIRTIGESILPEGKTYTFWGRGVSQGHSEAVRHIAGVVDAIQYTVPNEDALNLVREGKNADLNTTDMHERVCYVVAEEGADRYKIEDTIKNMPDYFAPYKTSVNFISLDELRKNHHGMPHGGRVFRTGVTSRGIKQKLEFHLELDSNPEFTASVLVAFARAVYRLAGTKQYGAKTVLDIPIGYLAPKLPEELRKTVL